MLLATIVVASIADPTAVNALVTETTFQAYVNIELCPEYTTDAAEVKLSYRIADSSTAIPIEVNSELVDLERNRATYYFDLPRVYASAPLHISAQCKLGNVTSAPSNEKTLSNCDALALIDTDGDGIRNIDEDRNCDNSYSPGDYSNPDNVDTDGDGVRDLVEIFEGTDPSNPGSSPRPFVFNSAPFDPDGNGDANAFVWRASNGNWYVRDFQSSGNHIALRFGLAGDIPFAYQPRGQTSSVGVIRRNGTSLTWYFAGAGFEKASGERLNQLNFGIFGDNIVLGPWERPDSTNPAVARLYQGNWHYFIFLRSGEIRHT
ncbi:MAG: hypothetical protein KDD53_12020, partial [Bdellovibrionales bacterium]|nr:hypothetical protein [Bdellovibrionales bacterium]